MKEFEFDATILKRDGMDATFIEFPFDVEQEFGVKGQVKVLTVIAKAFFETLSYTNKKEYVQWVESAKREETRQARLERSIVLLGEMVRHP